MPVIRRNLATATLLLAASLTSCQHFEKYLSPAQGPEGDLGEVTEVRTDLEAEWASVEELVDGIETDVRDFVSRPVPVELERTALAAAVFDRATQVSGLEEASADARSWANQYVESGRSILDRVQNDVPETIQRAVQSSTSAVTDAARIQAVVEQKLTLGRENPLLGAADLADLEAELAAVKAEQARIVALQTQSVLDAEGYSARLAAALGQFSERLSSLGE